MATSSSQTRSSGVKNRNVAANLRGAIPLTKQTDPNEFPAYEHVEFPKMMLQADGKPYVDKASGDPIVVIDEDEEREFRTDHPDTLDVQAGTPSPLSLAERLELDELRKLKAQLSDGKPDDPVPVPNRLAAATTRRPVSAARRAPALKDKHGNPLPKNL